MENFLRKNFWNLLFYDFQQKKTAKVFEKIHSQRKSPNSPAGFRFGETKRKNPTTLPKISPRQKQSFGAGLVQHRALLWRWV